MKLILLTIGLLLGITGMANSEDTRGRVMKLGDEVAAAQQRGGVAFLSHILADDFVLIGPRGFVLNKEQYLARYKAGALQPGSSERDQVQLRTYGDTAIMTAHEIAAGSYEGHPFRNELRTTEVFVKRNSQWQLVHIQLSPVLGAPPAASR